MTILFNNKLVRNKKKSFLYCLVGVQYAENEKSKKREMGGLKVDISGMLGIEREVL